MATENDLRNSRERGRQHGEEGLPNQAASLGGKIWSLSSDEDDRWDAYEEGFEEAQREAKKH